jgi:hypothetical protein
MPDSTGSPVVGKKGEVKANKHQQSIDSDDQQVDLLGNYKAEN